MQIVVIDLGVGNLRSVAQAVHAVADSDVLVSSNVDDVRNADKVVLPGQGAVGSWFRELDSRGLRKVVMDSLAEKPLLGICVGMQALFDYCEEDGGQTGLGVFKGEVRHFGQFHRDKITQRVSIPQMGWNQVKQVRDHPLWQGIADGSDFYFLHSFCANSGPQDDDGVIVGAADYHHPYIAAVAKDNVFATQFHPEKSHNDGLQLMRNFCQWNGQA